MENMPIDKKKNFRPNPEEIVIILGMIEWAKNHLTLLFL
jgi:hypothetical protein